MRRPALLAVLVLMPRLAAAQPSRQPVQELFFTEVVYPQEKRELQLTLGSLVDRTRKDDSALTPVNVEFGLTDRWQLQASWNGYSRFRDNPFPNLRMSRLSVGTKYSWMNIGGSRLHAAAGFDVEFSRRGVFPEGEGEEGTEAEPFLSMALDLGRGVTVFGSGAVSLERKQVVDVLLAQPPEDTGTISGGLLLRRGRVTLAGEYTSRSDAAPWRIGGSPLVTPSIIVRPGGDWELAVGAPFAVRTSSSHRPGLAMHLIKELQF